MDMNFGGGDFSQKETPVMAGVLISASSIAGFEY
jgi:hypothetical protein